MPSVSDTAYPRLKINPSAKELNELYTPTVYELAFARERARQPLQSIIWRSQWEASGGAAVKRSLLIYNANDCEALEVVANKLLQLQELSQNPEQSREIVFTASLKWQHPFGFKRNKFALTDLDTINKAAYWDYQRERVYVKSNGCVKRAFKFASHRKKSVRPNKIIECSRPRSCPKCGASKIYQHTKSVFKKSYAWTCYRRCDDH
jgi:hypothetical protein